MRIGTAPALARLEMTMRPKTRTIIVACVLSVLAVAAGWARGKPENHMNNARKQHKRQMQHSLP